MKSPTTWNFGAGEVPAYRHRNYDGSIGGWVAESAAVSPAAFIGRRALVSGGEVCARVVSGHVSSGRVLCGELRRGEVCGGVLRGGAVRGGFLAGGLLHGGVLFGRMSGGDVYDGEIHGHLSGGVVYGGVIRAEVSCGTFRTGALIRSADDYRVFGPLGSRGDYLTAYRTGLGSVKVATGCWHGSLSELRGLVESGPSSWAAYPPAARSRFQRDYLTIIDLLLVWERCK